MEISRAGLSPLTQPGPVSLSTGYERAIGFALPLMVGAGESFSDRIMAYGCNSFMLLLTISTAAAGNIFVFVDFLTPGGISWGDLGGTGYDGLQVASPSSAAVGTFSVPFGDRGGDQASSAQGFVAPIFRIGLTNIAGPPSPVVSAARLYMMTRP
jgi:hypothetical protein